jgi:hypothetical protein
MKLVGIRLNDDQERMLEELTSQYNTTSSDLIRSLLEDKHRNIDLDARARTLRERRRVLEAERDTIEDELGSVAMELEVVQTAQQRERLLRDRGLIASDREREVWADNVAMEVLRGMSMDRVRKLADRFSSHHGGRWTSDELLVLVDQKIEAARK